MNEILNTICNFAEVLENLFIIIYKTLRYESPFGCLTFYIYAFLALYFILKQFKKPETLYYGVVDESQVSSVLSTVQKKNNEIIRNLDSLNTKKDNERKPDYNKRLVGVVSELKVVESMYLEFQEEISDSHQSISESLKLPVMK